MRNVTDDVHVIGTSSLYGSLGFFAAMFDEPRTYGVELRYRFGAER